MGGDVGEGLIVDGFDLFFIGVITVECLEKGDTLVVDCESETSQGKHIVCLADIVLDDKFWGYYDIDACKCLSLCELIVLICCHTCIIHINLTCFRQIVIIFISSS